MKYHYFVHYKALTDEGSGVGSAEVVRRQKIKTSGDIKSIERAIEMHENATKVVLCNYILMRRSIK